MKNVSKKPRACAIFVDIRSSHNVGSMFRTADALGLEKMYLVGITPPPKDRFGRINKEIAKTALGAEISVSWEVVGTAAAAFKKVKKLGFQIVAIEQSEAAKDYKKFTAKKPIAFVVGNEVEGLNKKALGACDDVLEIPMRGEKESLNVSVAFGIALARILNL